MNIENAVFKKCSVDFDKLLKIGFIKENESYKYSKIFMNDNFRADIYIKLDGKLQSKVIELKFNEEYSNRHMKNFIGKFSNGVKEEYIAILKQYKRKKCFIENYFVFDQYNRIARILIDKYDIKPEFLWDKFPDYGVFRNVSSNK